jgi:hypothetical protein
MDRSNDLPGLVEYTLKKDEVAEFERMIEEYKARHEASKDDEEAKKKTVKNERPSKQAARPKLYETKQFVVDPSREQETNRKETMEVENPVPRSKEEKHTNLVEDLLNRFNYAVFSKEQEEVSEENIRRLVEKIELEQSRIEETIKKLLDAQKKKDRKSKGAQEVENERKKLKDLERLKSLYLDKLTLKQHME